MRRPGQVVSTVVRPRQRHFAGALPIRCVPATRLPYTTTKQRWLMMNRRTQGIAVAAVAVAALAGAAASVQAQNATTGTLGGVVRDAQQGVLPGAGVVAVHVPTGARYEAFAPGRRAVRPAERAGRALRPRGRHERLPDAVAARRRRHARRSDGSADHDAARGGDRDGGGHRGGERGVLAVALGDDRGYRRRRPSRPCRRSSGACRTSRA